MQLFPLLLMLSCCVSARHLAQRKTRNPQQNRQEENFLKALSILLSENDNQLGLSRTRKGRQLGVDLDGFEQDEVCEQTGFETRLREECNEVLETECTPIEVTKIRTEIVSKCKTKNEENCNITMREVPRQECTPSEEKRCETAYRVVEDTLYNEECKVDVKHICEEHIKVPTYHSGHEYSQPQARYPQSDPYNSPYKIQQERYHHPPSTTEKPTYGQPSEHPHYPNKQEETKSRKKRENSGFQRFSGQSFGSMSYDTNLKEQDEKLTEIVRHIMYKVIETDQSLGEVNATLKIPEAADLTIHIPSPKTSLTEFTGFNIETFPPVISTHELPAPYGCRTIATKMCFKVPMVVPKRVPYEKCKNIPSVDCAIVLKKVPELECAPKLFEECMDVAQETPYLASDEVCEEVAYDDCVEIEEKIPVELCKRKRFNEESIFLTKGPVFRKEGPKRRNPVRV